MSLKVSKKGFKNAKDKRLSGRYISFPKQIYESQAYKNLSSQARDILLFVHSQYNGHNNGDLTCTFTAVKNFWAMKISNRTFYRKLEELLESDFLIKTVQGGKHKASRFAVASYLIDDMDNMELEKPSKSPIMRFMRHEIKNTGSHKTPKKADKVLR